jgi:hypothetical protein
MQRGDVEDFIRAKYPDWLSRHGFRIEPRGVVGFRGILDA